jgi:hypothetical protein
MTTDETSAVVSDPTDPSALADIPECAQDDDTAIGEEMETEESETMEKPILEKSMLLIRFIGDGKSINVASLLQSVLKWLFEIDSAIYFETSNPAWKAIKSIADFPTKEVDFMKCFDPTTNNRGSGSSVLISLQFFSQVSVGLMKKDNSAFVEFLKTKKIGIKTACCGSKNETLLYGLLGFNPDKTHRASLTKQLHAQLIAIEPDSAESKLLEKAKQTLPFEGTLPDFELQSRWINAEGKKFSAKAYGISCASEHADFFRSFLLRCYFETRIIGLGKLVQLGGKHNVYLPKAITWHNHFVEECAILFLSNISPTAMDQPFKRKKSASTEETTTIRRILLSVTEGKAVNIYESRDIASAGRWIIGINKDHVENITVIVATTIAKLYENEQILSTNSHFQEAPNIRRPETKSQRRKSNESGVSGFDDDDMSIQSMQSKTWSAVTMGDSGGSVPKPYTNRTKPTIQFVFDPESTEEFPALPNAAVVSPRADTASVSSVSTVTKSDFEAFQTKLSNDMAENLKACQSMASSVTDSNQPTAIEELRAERLALANENRAARQQQSEQNQQLLSMFMQLQNMMSNLFSAQGPPPGLPPRHPPFQQQYAQHQHQQFDHHANHLQQQHLAQQQHQQQQHQQQQQQQQPSQHHQQQQQQQQHPPQPHLVSQQQPPQSPMKSQQLFTGTPSQQHQHYNPEQQSQQTAPEPFVMPPNMTWDPYQNRVVPITDPNQQLYRHPEEQVEFEYPTSMVQLTASKRSPGGTGQTFMSPPKKKTGTNASIAYHENAPNATTLENSSSEGAGGVQ